MRPFAMIAMLSLLIAAPAVAGPVGVHPGVKVGVAVANFNGTLSDATDLRSRSQMTFGGFLRFDLGGVLALQPEMQYVPKGGRGSFVITDDTGVPLGTADGTLKLDYLEFPVLLKVNIPSGGLLSPNFYVAPSAAVNLASKLTADVSALGLPESVREEDVKDQVKSLDFGGSIGGGFDVRTGKGLMTIDARYTLGFGEIFNAVQSGGVSGVAGAVDDKNRTLSVTVGYAF